MEVRRNCLVVLLVQLSFVVALDVQGAFLSLAFSIIPMNLLAFFSSLSYVYAFAFFVQESFELHTKASNVPCTFQFPFLLGKSCTPCAVRNVTPTSNVEDTFGGHMPSAPFASLSTTWPSMWSASLWT